MKIKWLGHSSFLLEESTGTKVVTDPFDAEIVGYPMTEAKANIITVSHSHKDHNAVENVIKDNNTVIIDKSGAYDLQGVHIYGIGSNHDEAGGKKRGKNIIYKYRIDGVDLCHLGDIGEECSIKLAEAIGAVDVLMIPVGGTYTIDADQAREFVEFLMPDIVIPMHYRVGNSKLDIDRLDQFLKLFDDEQIKYIDGDMIEFDRSMFEGEDTKVIVFDSEF